MRSRYKEKKEERKIESRGRRKAMLIKLSIIAVIIIILTLIWGIFVEPNLLTIKDYKVVNEKIPQSFDGLRIVHFTDLHYGNYKEKRMKKMVDNINSLKPDIVVFTGDLIEEGYTMTDEDTKSLISYLKDINSKFGKYAVYGNHDVKNENFDNILYDSSFKVLKNNYDTIYSEKNEPILIYGLDDIINGKPKIDSIKNKDISNIPYKIVLLHEPDYVNEFIFDYDINLVLAGHSHNGQVKIPGVRPLWLPEGCRKYYKGYYNVNSTSLYISNGVGNSMLDIRVASEPSINIYRLYQK